VPVPEEPDNEITLEDALKLKAEKKAALMALMKKEDSNAAKVVDDSAFKGMAITKKDDTDHMPGFEISNEKAKIRRDREKKGGEKKTVDVGFKTAPVQTDDRDDRGGRGGRDGGRGGGDRRDGGRGGRDGGRGGRGGRGDDRPRREGGVTAAPAGAGGRGGFSTKIDDDSAFPTLGGK